MDDSRAGDASASDRAPEPHLSPLPPLSSVGPHSQAAGNVGASTGADQASVAGMNAPYHSSPEYIPAGGPSSRHSSPGSYFDLASASKPFLPQQALPDQACSHVGLERHWIKVSLFSTLLLSPLQLWFADSIGGSCPPRSPFYIARAFQAGVLASLLSSTRSAWYNRRRTRVQSCSFALLWAGQLAANAALLPSSVDLALPSFVSLCFGTALSFHSMLMPIDAYRISPDCAAYAAAAASHAAAGVILLPTPELARRFATILASLFAINVLLRSLYQVREP